MASSSRSDTLWSRLSTPSMVVVVAVVFASLAYEPSYETPRPARQPFPWDPGEHSETVASLVTGDPLEAAYTHLVANFGKDGRLLVAPEDSVPRDSALETGGSSATRAAKDSSPRNWIPSPATRSSAWTDWPSKFRRACLRPQTNRSCSCCSNRCVEVATRKTWRIACADATRLQRR